MKLRTKILLPVVLLILVLTAGLSIVYIWFIGGLAVEQFEKRGISLAGNMASVGKLGVLMKDPSQLEKAMDIIGGEKEVQFVSFLDEQGNIISTKGALTNNDILQSVKQAKTSFAAESKTAEGSTVQLSFHPVFAREEGSAIVGFVVVGTSKEQLYSNQRNTMFWSLGFAFLLLGIGTFVLRFILQKTVINPLQEVTDVIRNADLKSSFHSSVQDEVGELQRTFDTFVSSIKDTLVQVSESSAAVASASTQISSSTEEMAAGAQEQSSQTSEVATAVDQMTKTLAETNSNIRKVADGAKQAKDNAQQGGEVVNETIKGMQRIAEVVNQSADQVKILGSSSDKIGEIIGVIDDIADQTNLLALNAAIEAARAGEQGRGFAVVADEVRKLAERTTKATKEIASMIRQIQSDTVQAVSSMEKGTQEVGKGISLAEEAGEMLQSIVGNAQNVSEMVAQIAASSDEQYTASEQISKNIEAINTVTQESASGVQQIAKTAEDLNRLTDTLQELLKQFNLEGEHRSVETHPYHSYREQKSTKAVSTNGHLVEQ